MPCMKRLMLLICVKKANWIPHKKFQPNSKYACSSYKFQWKLWVVRGRPWNHLYLDLPLVLVVTILKSSFRKMKLEITHVF